MEKWKDIEGYENIYQASDLGRVKSLSRYAPHSTIGVKRHISERILKPNIGNSGYEQVMLSVHGTVKGFLVHQLVAIAFLNHAPNNHLMEVNHLDKNRLNNNLKNLEVLPIREHRTKDSPRGTSKYSGVHWAKSCNKWRCSITINGINQSLGAFESEKQASLIYEKALVNLHLYKGDTEKFRILLGVPPASYSSKYIGVSYRKDTCKWTSYLKVNNKRKYLGCFLSELEAHQAYQSALKQI